MLKERTDARIRCYLEWNVLLELRYNRIDLIIIKQHKQTEKKQFQTYN